MMLLFLLLLISLFVSCYYYYFSSFSFIFLRSEYTEFFFVLMHCEARERFSRPVRSGMCVL